MKYAPSIVVVAYNRPNSIRRLLFSLRNLISKSEIKLIISIDNKEPDNLEVLKIADDYDWPFGNKEVIYHPRHLGLKQHVLQCGDLSQKYGSVIILEDDLFVSPHMYDYAVKALEYYEADESIGGISLFNQPRNEMVLLPFTPINDDSDVYFLQFPSSLGQAWTKDHWMGFRKWYNESPDISKIVHKNILTWPETSWKKYFAAYLNAHNKYFVFPRHSFTTNFNDPGTHMKKLSNFEGQVQLRLYNGPYRFKDISDSYCRYDATLELLPVLVKQLSSKLDEYDFEMDLYGLKDLQSVKKPYIITSKQTYNPVRGFMRALKPHEMNVILDLEGNDLSLCRTGEALTLENEYIKRLADYRYYYTRHIPGWKLQSFNYVQRIRQRMKNF